MTPLLRLWATGLAGHQRGRLSTTIIGIGLAVSLLATLFGFLATTLSTMTEQAIADVPVDWQVQLSAGTNPADAIAELTQSPGASNAVPVGYFSTSGFEATTGSTVQTTGAGKVLGLGPGYRDAFPKEIRDLAGTGSVMLAQQTAANLHAAPGTVISIARPGLPPVQVTIESIVDLPFADSLFQTVGAPAGSPAQAPPDNVLLLPLDLWHQLFDPAVQIDPSAGVVQVHATIPHNLAADPTSAYQQVAGKARNYETRLAGSGVVGDNLAARLDVARSDASYARILFLFLGAPGVALATLLTAVFVTASATRRRRDEALLRLRGASSRDLVSLAAIEASIVSAGAAVVGLVLSSVIVRSTFHRWGWGTTVTSSILWAAVAVLVGTAIAFLMICLPAWWDARRSTVNASRGVVSRKQGSWWERIGLDVLLLAAAATVYWQQARNGYHIVLVPEGVPQISVSYWVFVAPVMLWAGGSLLVVRLTRWALSHDAIRFPLIRPFSDRLGHLIGSAIGRQRGRTATGLVIVAVAIAFAVSTSVFNSTYEHQSLVDARLTNGADVTVTGNASVDLAGRQPALAAVPGVKSIEPMQHRFAYVGTDLQDLYGVNAGTLARTASLSNSFFLGGSATDVMANLARTPDGVLVSPETVSDFQLQPGDTLKLRLQSATDQQYHVVTFHYAGIAREFPTAPSDSFLVANADYVAAQTQSPQVETLLIGTNESSTAVAGRIQSVLGPGSGATVTDIQQASQTVTSGLTAVSLHGLTRIELLFAVLFAAAGAGLVLMLGLDERRRTLAILSAVGAKPREMRAFILSEASLVLVGGVIAGLVLGWIVAGMLIKMLTGVFDPPPDRTVVPLLYLTVVVVLTGAAMATTTLIVSRIGRRDVLPALRRL
jgi:putative ABC transport system permease protein